MGPLMNLALAVVLMAVVLMQGAEIPSFEDKPVVVGRSKRIRQPSARAFDQAISSFGE